MEPDKVFKMENWSVQITDPYSSPEMGDFHLAGNVYGNPKFEEGKHIITSRIKKVNGNLITTKTGSVYELCEPEPEYVEFCKNFGGHIPTKEKPMR